MNHRDHYLRLLRWSVLLMMVFPLVLAAQEGPARGRFRRGPTSRPYWGWGMRGMMEAAGRRWHRFGQEPTTQPSEQQWNAIAEYMKRDLPNAWEFYERQPPQRQERIKQQIFAEFEATQFLRESGQIELYKLKLRERKTMDEVSGLIKRWRRATLDQKPMIRDQIREKVRLFLDDALKERELRIKRLEKQLNEAKARVSDDRQHIDQLLERRMNHLLNQRPPSTEPAQ